MSSWCGERCQQRFQPRPQLAVRRLGLCVVMSGAGLTSRTAESLYSARCHSPPSGVNTSKPSTDALEAAWKMPRLRFRAQALFNEKCISTDSISATTMAQLESNLASESLRLDGEVLEAIEEVHRRYPNPAP